MHSQLLGKFQSVRGLSKAIRGGSDESRGGQEALGQAYTTDKVAARHRLRRLSKNIRKKTEIEVVDTHLPSVMKSTSIACVTTAGQERGEFRELAVEFTHVM